MLRTTLSTKGQIVLPVSLRNWDAGTEFYVSPWKSGIWLQPKIERKRKTVAEVAGILAGFKPPKLTDTQVEAGIAEMLFEQNEATKPKRRQSQSKLGPVIK